MPGGTEVLVILFVILLIFGGKKIPELMKGLGKGINEFKKGMADINDVKSDIEKPLSNKVEDK
jgi:sec-independent protein translocase protein TatA